MTERSGFVNPNICIDPMVQETTEGKGYCNPLYRRKFRDEATGCKGCPKPTTIDVSMIKVSIRSFMSPGDIKEDEIALQFKNERIRKTARRTGRFLRM